jgi:hypothetical protein
MTCTNTQTCSVKTSLPPQLCTAIQADAGAKIHTTTAEASALQQQVRSAATARSAALGAIVQKRVEREGLVARRGTVQTATSTLRDASCSWSKITATPPPALSTRTTETLCTEVQVTAPDKFYIHVCAHVSRRIMRAYAGAQ